MTELARLLQHVRHGRAAGWHPLLAVYYLTYRCTFRCPYCSDGHQKPYWAQPERTPTAEQALAILTTMRRWCDRLVVTGGEPLQHPEVDHHARVVLRADARGRERGQRPERGDEAGRAGEPARPHQKLPFTPSTGRIGIPGTGYSWR
jgi:hypothetical protein